MLVDINNDWGAGYCAGIVLENTGSSPITWNVSFEIEGSVNNLWNGSWSQQGAIVSVSGIGWNNVLEPGEVDTSMGFCADR